MIALRKLAMVAIGSTVLLLSARGGLPDETARTATISSGSVTTRNGSWLSVGQAAIGPGKSDTHQMRAGGIPVILQVLSTQRLPGDLDTDGDVDADDHSLFVDCMGGPGVSVPPQGCTPELFDLADIEGDQDVDLGDFRNVSAAFTAR